MDKFFKILLMLGVVITPLLADDGDVLVAIFGGIFIFFLVAQSSFAKTIATSNPMLKIRILFGFGHNLFQHGL